MKLTLLQKILSLSIFSKAFALKKGALIILSIPISIGLFEGVKKLLKNVDVYNLVLPIITIVSCISLYFLFFLVDFVWGLIASKHKAKSNPDWVKSEKLYSSLGKIGGVLLVNVLLLSIIIFLVIINFITVSNGLLIIAVLLNILAILYELHSIGENIKTRTRKKPKILSFFDSITTILEKKILSKTEKFIE